MTHIINNWQMILLGWLVLSIPTALFIGAVIKVGGKDATR